jgi:flagellin
MALNSVITNAGAMVALQSLNKTNDAMDTTQKRISTGYRVSDAKDDGAAFAVAQKVRGDMSGLTSANEQLGGAKGLLDTTLAGLNKVSTTMSELKGVMTKLADNKVTGEERKGYEAQFDKLTTSVSNYISDATYNGKSLLVAPKTDAGAVARNAEVLDDLPADPTAHGVAAFTATPPALLDADATDAAKTTYATDKATYDRAVAEFAAGSASAADKDAVATYTTAWNEKEQINTSNIDKVKSAGFAGTLAAYATAQPGLKATYDAALAKSDINVVRNEKATSYEINAIDLTSLQIVKPKAAAGAEISAQQWSEALNGGVGAQPVANSFAAAEKNVNAALVQFGNDSRSIDGQISFNKDRLDALESGLGALIDADLAKESARMQSLTIRQQLGTTSLSTANQQPSSLLSLFR